MKFRHCVLAGLLLASSGNSLADAPLPPSSGSAATVFNSVVPNDVLSRMFRWWNAAYKDPNGFTEQAFSQYFTPDVDMVINGSLRAHGLPALAARFRGIQKEVDQVEIHLPFVTSFSSPEGSAIFTSHHETSVKDGKVTHTLVMGYAQVRDGKISKIDFLSLDQ